MDKIKNRITELEQNKENMEEISKLAREELAVVENKASELKKTINDNNFSNTEEYRELEELKTTQKWINWAKDIETP